MRPLNGESMNCKCIYTVKKNYLILSALNCQKKNHIDRVLKLSLKPKRTLIDY